MSTITELTEYTPIGNTLEDINRNFHLMNNRICVLQQTINKWQSFSDTINSIKNDLIDQKNFLDRNKQRYTDTSNIVFNSQEFWKEPINIVYGPGFATVGNYVDALLWLNNTFPASNFLDNQHIRLEFLIKSYDPVIMDNYPIGELSYTSLTAIANSYGHSVKDITDYLCVTNQMATVVNAVNAILVRNKRPDLLVTTPDQLLLIFNDIVFSNNVFSSTSLLTNFSISDIQLIYSLLDQHYTLFVPKQKGLLSVATDIPADVLIMFDNKFIYTNFVGHFTFVNDKGTWQYIPNILSSVPQVINCNSCFDYVDLDKIYNDRNCKYAATFELIECELPNASYGETLIP